MAENAEAKAADTPAESNPSMEEILRSIRGVIAGGDTPPAAGASQTPTPSTAEADEDILELTEVAPEAAPAPVAASAETPAAATTEAPATPEEKAPAPVAEEAPAAVPAPETPAAATEAPKEKSVLDTIDEALGESKPDAPTNNAQPSPSPTAKAAPSVDDDTLEAAVDPAGTKTMDVLELEKGAEASASDESTKKRSSRLLTEQTADVSSATLKKLMDNVPRIRVDSPVMRSGTTLEDLVIEALTPLLAEWLNDNLPIIVRQLVEKEIRKLVPNDDA